MKINMVCFILSLGLAAEAYALPNGFVYLYEIDPTILQEMRYAHSHNFIGRPVVGYLQSRCIVTKEAAMALAAVQKVLRQSSLSLKVYDCYRPTSAVADFAAWSKDASHQEMKHEFYPNVNKADLFKLGYIAARSGHSRGSTVDLTIVRLPTSKQQDFKGELVSCAAGYRQRYRDNSIDMGTGYDCMDVHSAIHYPFKERDITVNRQLLQNVMRANGFQPYTKEWWHFTLLDEAFPNTYYNFPVT